MPRPKGSYKTAPSYCHHKASGQAYVTLAGQVVYLGDFGSRESRAKYERVVGEWLANGRTALPPSAAPPRPAEVPAGITVVELVDAFWTHAKGYYAYADGSPAGELDNFRLALRPLKRLYGNTAAKDFGPLCLKTIRAETVKPRTETDPRTEETREVRGWSRTHANRQIARLKQVFSWAVENELVPAAVYQALAQVKGLRKGRGGSARESEPVRPVSNGDVDATLPHLSPHLRAMVNVQRLTGMRSSEVCTMTTGAIDRSGNLWVYRPAHHKTEHHGHDREIYLNAEAQAALAPFLKLDPAAFLFSPAESEAARLEKLRAGRKTKVQPSQMRRAELAKRRKRQRAPGARYTRESYRKAVAKGCRRAGVPTWHPHQLRHTYGTLMRKRHGIETARILLGHKSPAMTLVYAEADRAKAMQAVADVG